MLAIRREPSFRNSHSSRPGVPIGSWNRRRGLAVFGLVVLGFIVYLPSLRSGFLLDDYLQASMIDGTYPISRGPFDLYDFVDPPERSTLVERGMVPWFADPRLQIRFLRPLPSVLRWTEQRLFGRAPALHHLHSLLWLIAAVLAARRLYYRVFSPSAAFIATLIFALSPCHALPLAWLANREALISLTFGALALTSYLRWRQEGGIGHAAATAALFALSMTGGEYALCMGGYVVALDLLAPSPIPAGIPASEPHATRPWARRFGGTLLFGAPAVTYLGARAILGYGTRASTFYLDLLHEPLAFLGVAPRRVAQLLAFEWLTLDTYDPAPWAAGAFVVVAAALLATPLKRALATLDPSARGRAYGFFLGSQIALVPVLGVDPSPRVLGAAMLGLAPVLGIVLDYAWFPKVAPARSIAAQVTDLVALAIGFFQLVHGPIATWRIGMHYRATSEDFQQSIADLRRRIEDPDRTELVVLRTGPSSLFMPFALAADGRAPARWRVLATTGHVLGLRRSSRVLELVAPSNSSLCEWGLFGDPAAIDRPGTVFDTPGMRATVLDVGRGGPRRVEFEFDRDLGSPGLMWITESGKGGFPSASLPDVGYGQAYDP